MQPEVCIASTQGLGVSTGERPFGDHMMMTSEAPRNKDLARCARAPDAHTTGVACGWDVGLYL